MLVTRKICSGNFDSFSAKMLLRTSFWNYCQPFTNIYKLVMPTLEVEVGTDVNSNRIK